MNDYMRKNLMGFPFNYCGHHSMHIQAMLRRFRYPLRVAKLNAVSFRICSAPRLSSKDFLTSEPCLHGGYYIIMVLYLRIDMVKLLLQLN